MRRVFLDANILVSAAWRQTNGLLAIWDRTNLHLVTSIYALVEAERNIQLKNPAAVARLDHLISQLEVGTSLAKLNSNHGLPEKDLPILQAAVGSNCEVLLTGDKAHFGHLFGKEVEGVRVLTVSEFFAELE